MKKCIGNILSVTSGVIIQQANAQGVMGSGVAKAIRDKYPQVFTEYSAYVGVPYSRKDSGASILGSTIVTQVSDDLTIISIIGQQFFGRDGRKYTSYDALDSGFSSIAEMVRCGSIPNDIHHPLIGSDLGGGEWSIVKSIIEHHLPTSTLWVLQNF